jgi:hypothetical protein
MIFNPSDAYIDECIKILKRFLKEKGRYWQMMNFLFKNGRGKSQFYEDVRRLYDEGYDFRDILHMTYTLGPADTKLGIDYWDKFIRPISDEFKDYFPRNKHKIKSSIIDTSLININ